MKAVVCEKYGSPDVLKVKDVKMPKPKRKEVLIKIRAVSINASDWEMLTAKPAYIRMLGPLKPKYKILGSDIAGIVEQVGKDVKEFIIGDAVFVDTFTHNLGGFASYVCVPEDEILLKPKELTFEEAAALPQASTVALQGLRDMGEIKSGQKVLINGAGGGAGTFAIQLAKMYGVEVTGVDSTEKLNTVLSIGADYVIDYTKENFTKKWEEI